MKMIEYVTVEKLKALDGFQLWMRFSDGSEGVRNFVDILAEGGDVIEPIKDEAMFRRVFLSFGVPTWPSGLQLDPSNLHAELREAGQLRLPVAAE
jgi:hypothetical protein